MRPHICQYCNQPCDDRDEADLVSEWWFCSKCETNYEIHYTGYVTKIYMDVNLKDNHYGLQLLLDTGESRIVMYPPEPDDTLVLVVTFPYILKGFTPQNVSEKIRTYINFS